MRHLQKPAEIGEQAPNARLLLERRGFSVATVLREAPSSSFSEASAASGLILQRG